MMFLADLEAVGHITQARGLLFVVDNTFATPYFQQPIALGADIVLHSTTKYLNGHSDMLGGMLVTARDDLAERMGFLQNAAGGVPGPMDCWLCLRGIKTLPLRMRQHDSNGRTIAGWLTRHPRVQRVYYPGLTDHPQHQLAARQMRGFGGMVSVELGDPVYARRVPLICILIIGKNKALLNISDKHIILFINAPRERQRLLILLLGVKLILRTEAVRNKKIALGEICNAF